MFDFAPAFRVPLYFGKAGYLYLAYLMAMTYDDVAWGMVLDFGEAICAELIVEVGEPRDSLRAFIFCWAAEKDELPF